MKGKIVSHYKILEKLGGGGMGEVYKAEDLKLRRTVALKFLPAYFSRDSEAKKRFILEAQTASSLDHPNICTIYEIDETSDFPDQAAGKMFIAMAYYEGEILKNKIQPRLISQNDAVNIAIQVAKGLAKAHQQGIIHRDIKPANIIITRDNVVKILDFGLARLAGRSDITRPGITMGTLSYISPEQIQGKRSSHTTDIWSFGVMLYEMLTGELPFKGEIDQAVIYSILNEAPEPLKIKVPRQLQRILHRLLEKNQEDRYQNMDDVISDLKTVESQRDPGRMEKSGSSVAVLPFRNMSGDYKQEYLCEGIAEEIINALTLLKGLRVVSRTSSFAFKEKQMEIREIGRKLNVALILEGSVRKMNNQLRITAQLINVADGCHIWSARYDRTYNDIFAIQDEISLSVADKLKIELMESERTELTRRQTFNLKAFNMYLKGRYYSLRMTKEDISKAIGYFEKTIEIDPKYTQAYASLSLAWILLTSYWFVPSEQVSSHAREAAKKALELNPNLSEALACQGLIKILFEWDFEGSRKDFLKSREVQPDTSIAPAGLAFYYVVTGNTDEAIKILEHVLEVNPLAVNINNNIGVYLLRCKKYQEARDILHSLLDFVPDHPYSLWILGQTYILESQYEIGIKLIQKALDYSNQFAPILAALGWAYARIDKPAETRKILNKMKKKAKSEYINPYLFAKIYAALNEKDKAFQWLNKAVDEKDHAILQIITDESVDNLRSDRRFPKLLKKMGLYSYYIQIKNK